MTTLDEELSKAAPGPLALVQALVNTHYGQGRRAHVELTSPEQLCAWLVAHRLLPDGTPVSEGDFRRVVQLREALRSLLERCTQVLSFVTELTQDTERDHFFAKLNRFEHRSRCQQRARDACFTDRGTQSSCQQRPTHGALSARWSANSRTGYRRRGWRDCPPGRDRVHRHDGRHLGQAQNLSQ
jgi:putative stress-induced transcription regulator